MQIIDYGTEYGEEKLYKQLESDLRIYLLLIDFNVNDLNTILGIIWFYFVFRKQENILKKDWEIPTWLVEIIKSKFIEFSDLECDLETSSRIINQIASVFNFTDLEVNH